nr:MAG TPA: hypothetical protein [Caudoviricetes sp.]
MNFKIRCNNQSFISWFCKTNYRKHHISKSVFDEFLTAIKKEGSNYATLNLFI